MNEKTKLRIIQILCIVSLIITVFSIQKTYAKYFEKVNTTYATNIKRWVININGTDIHGKEQELSQIMTPVLRENQHINNNVFVPGREGYFEFVIDYSKVDLSFKVDFDIQQLNTVQLEDFEIYGYSIVTPGAEGAEVTETITNLETVNNLSGLSQIINPSTETNKIKTIRILFRWNDENTDTTDNNEADGMNNYEDTQYKGNTIEGDSVHTNLNYKVKVTFKQYF